MTSNDLYGLVLIGGQSSRMGREKYKLQFHQTEQLPFLMDLLAPYCKKVFISCRKEQTPGLGEYPNKILDRYSNIGPMAGILSALEEFETYSWLVVACDMPSINERHIMHLIINRNSLKIATCFYNEITQEPEPLFTIYENHFRERLLSQYKAGQYSLKRILQQVDIQKISPVDNEMLVNINTPSALNQYKNEN